MQTALLANRQVRAISASEWVEESVSDRGSGLRGLSVKVELLQTKSMPAAESELIARPPASDHGATREEDRARYAEQRDVHARH